MNSANVLQRLSMGEDSQTRFLPNLPDTASLAQELVALANGGGGYVYVGIDVRGGVLGLTAGNRAQARRTAHVCAKRYVQPSITIETVDVEVNGRLVQIVRVREGAEKPYFDSLGRFWVKCAAANREIPSHAEAVRLLRPTRDTHGDRMSVDGTTTGDVDMDHFGEFFAQQYGETLDTVLERDDISVGRLLNNMGLALAGNLNLASLLAETCRHNGWKLVTNDSDFTTGGIEVLTSHPVLLRACP